MPAWASNPTNTPRTSGAMYHGPLLILLLLCPELITAS